ncbi:hypothetical protein F4804DRAFT_350588 [Jackrogersella minutella]|nr:hypothetical protein F4804DRAFT_350588 [Jackrogersella minutella]
MPPKQPIDDDEHDYTNEPLPALGNARHHRANELEIRRIEIELRDHFAKTRLWKYEKVLGSGFFGTAILVGNKTRRFNSNYRRLVVKRAITDPGETELRNEINWLTRLRGAEHIVAIVASRDDAAVDPAAVAPREPLFARLFRSGNSGQVRKSRDPRRIDDELNLRGLAGYPVLVLEYLENGTFARLIDRTTQHQTHLPNRLLWSIFLCLTRACVGMAYPMNREGGRRNLPEVFPAEGGPPGDLMHRYLHAGNVVFGDVDSTSQEHALIPIAKFIDFGAAFESPEGTGPGFNIYDISILMLAIITKTRTPNFNEQCIYRDIWTEATEILPEGNGANYPNLDDDLRWLLARCFAIDDQDRPTLQQLLTEVENAVRTKTAGTFPFAQAPLETDAAIKTFLQNLVYNADVEANGANALEVAPQDEHMGPPFRRLRQLVRRGWNRMEESLTQGLQLDQSAHYFRLD